MSSADKRFEYIQQKENIGAINNFKFLIDSAETEFFVFLASDDYWLPRFLEENIGRLTNQASADASISKVIFESSGQLLRASNGDFEIVGTSAERLNSYFSAPSDNSRFYSVFRTQKLKQCFESLPSFHALDWYIMAMSLANGNHVRVEDVLMHREIAPDDRYNKTAPIDNAHHHTPDSFPVLPMTIELLTKLRFRLSIKLTKNLFMLNIKKHKDYMLFKAPRSWYSRALSKII